jgi:hypothetical protein
MRWLQVAGAASGCCSRVFELLLVCVGLSAVLQVKDAKKAKFQLGTAEPKLGAAIQEATQVSSWA